MRQKKREQSSMNQSSNTMTHRRAWFIRIINYQIWLLCFLLAFGSLSAAIGILVFSREYPNYLFSLILSLLAIYILLYSRVSYFVAHGNKLILSSKGIEYHYLGIVGFANWEDMLFFDEDKERAWINSSYQTSDLRSMRVTILFFSWHIPIRNKVVLGIRLQHEPKLHINPLATVPKANLDFIPLSLLVDIPRLKDGSVNVGKFAKSKLGQELLNYAPFLFDEDERQYQLAIREQEAQELARWYAEHEQNNAHLFE
jgi:hypothetical protein